MARVYRGPSRLRRDGPNDWGVWAAISRPCTRLIEARHGAAATGGTMGGGEGPYRGCARVIEARHGFAGMGRTIGGVGAMSGPPLNQNPSGTSTPSVRSYRQPSAATLGSSTTA